jgi:hypothetical protein
MTLVFDAGLRELEACLARPNPDIEGAQHILEVLGREEWQKTRVGLFSGAPGRWSCTSAADVTL